MGKCCHFHAVSLARSKQEVAQVPGPKRTSAVKKPAKQKSGVRACSEAVVKVRKPERLYSKLGYDK